MIRLYLTGFKGLSLLQAINKVQVNIINDVVIARDANVINDYYHDITIVCKGKSIPYYQKGNEPVGSHTYSFAVSWRWLIQGSSTIFVLHDSLLPKLRGFNPLVTSLINGDEQIGVTSLLAAENYDQGPVIGQKSLNISHPIKIKEAIELVAPLYTELFQDIIEKMESGNIPMTPQDESLVTYSLWRDEKDYFIPWHWDAKKIKRFIDAVGFPYTGAKTYAGSMLLKVFNAEVVPDVSIENREPGKVIFKNQDGWVIVCGKGLLKIRDFFDEKNQPYDFSGKFRIRFHS